MQNFIVTIYEYQARPNIAANADTNIYKIGTSATLAPTPKPAGPAIAR